MSVALALGGAGRIVDAAVTFFPGQVTRLSDDGTVAWVRPEGPRTDSAPASSAPTTRPDRPAEIGYRVILHRQGRLSGTGQVMGFGHGHIAIRIIWKCQSPLQGDMAVVIGPAIGLEFREDLPPGTTIHAQVESLGPGAVNGWVSAGQADGLRPEDIMLIDRQDLPIASARVAAVDAHRAAVELTPLVANAQLRPGDHARLWPTPAEAAADTIGSVVLGLAAETDEPLVTVAGGTMVGIRQGDSFEFRRNGQYVGVGQVVRVDDRLSQVRPAQALCRKPVLLRDQAIRRPRAFAGTAMPARVFRIEQDYCLINVGEREDVRRGQTLVVVRDQTPIAKLRVHTVKEDYCGADVVERLNEKKVLLWDPVYSELFTPNRVVWIGSVTRVAPGRWAIGADRREDAGTPLLRNVVMFQARLPDQAPHVRGAGIVVAQGHDGVVIYAPTTWHRGPLVNVQVGLSQR